MRGEDGRLRELTEEEMKTAVFHDKEGPSPDSNFKKLSPEEAKKFKGWARENFKVNTKPDPRWHPVARDEWAKMQAQADIIKKT